MGGLIEWKDLYRQEGPSKGYVDMDNIIFNKLEKYPFIFMIGARGIGKTYAAVETTYKHQIPSVFLRRSQTQTDAISTNELFQGADFCKDNDVVYDIKTLTKNLYGVYFDESEYPLMVQGALTTLHNVRGFSMQERQILWYDEFLPEEHVKSIRGEGQALLNAYETINRNREIKGEKPLKLVAMSNSDKLSNPLFSDFNLITAADRQFSKGHVYYADDERGVVIINFLNSPISKKKKNTSLYKFAKGMDFEAMALENQFLDEKSEQRSYNKKSITPCVNIGEITIYRHKQNDEFYVSGLYMEAPTVFENTEKSITAWRKSDLCRGFYYMYLRGELYFESYNCEYLFKRYCENR